MKTWFAVGLSLLVMAGLVVWAPWLVPESAEEQVIHAFEAAWDGIIDGCGFSCQGCGVVGSQRRPAGIAVEIEFGCGMLPSDSQEFHQTAVVLLSALGSIHGLPSP